MITKVIIQNFQIHDDLVVEFDQVTTLIGSTDVGKSAVIRAIRWVCQNEPRGTAFVRKGSAVCTVTLEVDGHTITRQRGSTFNGYVMDGEEFLACGNSVPPKIQAVLKLGEYSFQGQHDAPFWFTLPAPQVSRELNKIVDLSLIDHTLGNLAKMTRKAGVENGIIDERLEEAHKTVVSLKKVPQLVMKQHRLERKSDVIGEKASHRLHLRELLEEVAEAGLQAERLSEVLQKGEKAYKAACRLAVKQDECELLSKMLDYGINQKRLSKAKIPSPMYLLGLAMKAEKYVTRLDALDCLLQDHSREVAQIKCHDSDVLDYEEELNNLMGETCPLCDQSLT